VPSVSSPVQKKCKLVIVDDHPMFLTLLGELLQNKLDIEVVGVAHSGEEGLEVCTRTQPDLVLIDMLMPGMSGLELIKILRKRSSKIMLLAISGYVTKDLINMALIAGANGYFSKSKSIEELLQKLQEMSEGRSEMTPEEAEAVRSAMRERRLRREISTNDLQLLRLFLEELPVKEIAVLTGRTSSGVYKALKRIKKRLEIKTDGELREAAKGLGLVSSKGMTL
jgi:DNA-binding NarL/FixJ family response regulator